jgi:hypothetical protein
MPRICIVGAAAASTAAYLVQTAALLVIYVRVAQHSWRDVLVPRAADWQVYRRLLTLRRGATR